MRTFWICLLLIPLGSQPFMLHAMTPSRAVVLVYDVYGLSERQRRVARQTAVALFGEMAIRLDWHECGSNASQQVDPVCIGPLASDVLRLRLVKASPATPPRVLGRALLAASQPSVLATVFTDHVEVAAAIAKMDSANLLGRVMAHELGHLLMGTPTHASSGLMRAEWSTEDMRGERLAGADWADRPVTGTVPTCRVGAKCPFGF